jgi:rhodanese-related sulfurtransferase
LAVFQGSGFVKKIYDGDASIMVVDSRTPGWVEKGTIPGAMNIPSVTRRANYSGIAAACRIGKIWG